MSEETKESLTEIIFQLLHTVDQIVDVREAEKQKNVLFVKTQAGNEFNVEVTQTFFKE